MNFFGLLKKFLGRLDPKRQNDAKILYPKDIFVSGGDPIHTYYPRPALDLESKIRQTTESRKLSIISGPTKSGKTVAMRKTLPQDRAVWVNGGSIKAEEDFWNTLVSKLELYTSAAQEISREKSRNRSASFKLRAKNLVAELEAGASSDLGKKSTASHTYTRALPSKIVVLQRLEEQHIPVIIDDFHFIAPDFQNSIIDAFKSLIFDGLPFIIITVPSRKREVFFRVKSEMSGRLETIDIPAWGREELEFIPKTGFDLLGYSPLGTWQVNWLVDQSMGSPHLMQDFCLRVCKSQQEKSTKKVAISHKQLENVFVESAKSLGRRMYAEVTTTSYQSTMDEVGTERYKHINEAIFRAIAHLNRVSPGTTTIDLNTLRMMIDLLSPQTQTQADEIVLVLQAISKIAATDESSIPVLEYIPEHQEIYICDPFFAFYINNIYREKFNDAMTQ